MDADAQPTVRRRIAEPAATYLLLWLGFPVIGGALLWGVSRIVPWAASQEWMLFRGLFRLADDVPEPFLGLGAIAVGVLLGLGIGFLGHIDVLTVTITDDAVITSRGGKTHRIPAASVDAVFRDRKYLVLLGGDGAELAREKTDLSTDRVRRAFVDCGFTWLDADPHAEQWRRWVDGTPDLPKGANALLRTRAKELKKMVPELADVDAELRKVGVMVRDEKGKQHWRLAERD